MNIWARWEIWALASAGCAALTAIFGKMGVMSLNSNLATFIRTLIILIFLSVVLSIKNQWQSPVMNMRAWVALVLSALATGLSWLFYWRAMQLGPVSKVASLDKLSLVFTVLLSVIFLSEKLSWLSVAGIVLMIAGALLLIIF